MKRFADISARSIVVLALGCAPTSVAGVPLGTLSGTVIDTEGAVIGLAHVFVRPDVSGRDMTTVTNDLNLKTDTAGVFSVRLEPGFYDVCVMADAFVPQCYKLSITNGKTTDRRIRLVIDWQVTDRFSDTV